jgi:hypothetical protein
MSVRRGLYRHYKGAVYWVEGVGVLHDETRRIVVYQSVQSAEDGEPRLRYEDEFEEDVCTATGSPTCTCPLNAHGSEMVPRFERIEP